MTDPAVIAAYDQQLAEAKVCVSNLKKTLDRLQEKHGELQGMADLSALLRTWDQSQLIAALLGALALGVCVDGED